MNTRAQFRTASRKLHRSSQHSSVLLKLGRWRLLCPCLPLLHIAPPLRLAPPLLSSPPLGSRLLPELCHQRILIPPQLPGNDRLLLPSHGILAVRGLLAALGTYHEGKKGSVGRVDRYLAATRWSLCVYTAAGSTLIAWFSTMGVLW